MLSDPDEYQEAIIRSKEWAWASNPSNWQDEDHLRRFIALEGIDGCRRLIRNPPRKPFSFEPGINTSGPGTLSKLPLEMMYKVMDCLDLSSAEALGRTCRMAQYMLEKHPSYKALIKFVPILKSATATCGLEETASLEDLAEELQYPYCRACGHQGTKLFLPLAERVCSNCVILNPAYWCMAIPDAMDAFCLSEAQVRALPILKRRGTVWDMKFFPQITSSNRQDLVPAKAAFLAAMRIWGNRKTMCRYAAYNDPDNDADVEDGLMLIGPCYRLLRDMQVKTPDDPTQLAEFGFPMPVACAKNVIIPFPYLPKGKAEPEPRFKCRGCDWLFMQPQIRAPMLKYLNFRPDLPPVRMKLMMDGRRNTAHSWKDLRLHIRGCAGAGFLMYQHGIERDFENGLGNKIFFKTE